MLFLHIANIIGSILSCCTGSFPLPCCSYNSTCLVYKQLLCAVCCFEDSVFLVPGQVVCHCIPGSAWCSSVIKLNMNQFHIFCPLCGEATNQTDLSCGWGGGGQIGNKNAKQYNFLWCYKGQWHQNKRTKLSNLFILWPNRNVSTWGGLEPPTFGFMLNALNIWAIRARHLLSHIF